MDSIGKRCEPSAVHSGGQFGPSLDWSGAGGGAPDLNSWGRNESFALRNRLRWIRIAIYGVLLALSFGAVIVNPASQPLDIILLSLCVIWIGVLPLIRYFSNWSGEFGVPVFELHCLYIVAAYGVTGLFAAKPMVDTLGEIGDEYWRLGLVATLLGLCSLLVGFYLIGPMVAGRPRRFDFGLSQPGVLEVVGLLCWAGSVIGSRVLPAVSLRQSFEVLEFFGFFMLLYFACSKEKSLLFKLFVFLLVLPFEFWWRGGRKTLFFFPIFILGWMVFIWLRTRRSFPWLIPVVAVALFLVMHPAKFYVREALMWDPYKPATFLNFLKSYREGLREQFQKPYHEGEWFKTLLEKAGRRVNNLATLCAVMRDTPRAVPFMKGETYKPLLVKWIPRIIWPSKPTELVGNQWAKPYGYIAEDDYVTSFNLPWLVEMYMNFGVPGILVGMLLLGILFRVLDSVWFRNPAGAAEYAFCITCSIFLVSPESNLSMSLGLVIIAAIELYVFAFVLRTLGVGKEGVGLLTGMLKKART